MNKPFSIERARELYEDKEKLDCTIKRINIAIEEAAKEGKNEIEWRVLNKFVNTIEEIYNAEGYCAGHHVNGYDYSIVHFDWSF